MFPVLRILLLWKNPILCLPRTLFVSLPSFSSSIECVYVSFAHVPHSLGMVIKKKEPRHVNNNIIQSSPRNWVRNGVPIPHPYSYSYPIYLFVFVSISEFPSGYFERVMYAFHVFFFYILCAIV